MKLDLERLSRTPYKAKENHSTNVNSGHRPGLMIGVFFLTIQIILVFISPLIIAGIMLGDLESMWFPLFLIGALLVVSFSYSFYKCILYTRNSKEKNTKLILVLNSLTLVINFFLIIGLLVILRLVI